MAGLFTLDDEGLGRLDEDALGGFGTGFTVGSSSSTGSVTGLLGYDGSVSGSSQSTATLSGAVGYLGAAAGLSLGSGSAAGSSGFSGAVNGSNTSAGSVSGAEGNTGTVTGSSSSTGSASGSRASTGSCTGVSVSDGSATGQLAATGSASGSSTSSGSVTGTKPEPLVPPDPEPEAGGVSMARWYVQPAPPVRHSGIVSGSTTGRGRAAGRCGYAGTVTGLTRLSSTITGRRSVPIPIEQRVRDHAAERRHLEDEALLLELL
jgi:hypothetical protein